MKLSQSICLVLLMSTMPIHATLAQDSAGNDETQVTQSVNSDANSNAMTTDNETPDFGPGGPGGGRPGGPGPGGPGGFHPGPGGPGGFHPGPVGPAPMPPGGGFHPGPGGPGFGGYRPGNGPGWNPGFPRPVFNWNWNGIQTVTCTAEDQYGNQYPYTESGYTGFGYQGVITNIEDNALNDCYQQSNAGCVFVGCTPGY
jgi:hypothetical protein